MTTVRVDAERSWSGDGLTVSIRESEPSRTVIEVRGDVDICSAPLLTAALAHQLDAGRRYVRLDLASVDFLDAAGIAAIVGLHRAYLDARGTLVLTAMPARMLRLLQLVNLDTALLICEGPPPSAASRSAG